MIQVQNVQQQPSQDVREQLYSQLEDYMGLSSTKKKMDSSENPGALPSSANLPNRAARAAAPKH